MPENDKRGAPKPDTGEKQSAEEARPQRRTDRAPKPLGWIRPGPEPEPLLAAVSAPAERTDQLRPAATRTPISEPEREPARSASRTVGDLPPALIGRYLLEKDRRGSAHAYVDLTVKEPAFTDSGDRLTGRTTNPDTIRDLVRIAEHRGWRSVAVGGTSDFRREAWFQASLAGLEVTGYKPRSRDLQALEQQRRPPEPTEPEPASRTRAEVFEGKLLENGTAPYQHKEGRRSSPFVRLEQADGKVVELWGVGLPGALREVNAQIGDQIRLRRAGADQVEVRVNARDPATGERSTEAKAVARTRWEATAERFRQSDPAAAARDPELRRAQGHLTLLTTAVSQRLPDGAVKEALKAELKQQVAGQLAAGREFRPAIVRTRQPSPEVVRTDRESRHESPSTTARERQRGR